VSSDGAYASKFNLEEAKARGIIDIIFNKAKGSMRNVAASNKMEAMLKKWRSA